MTTAAPCLIILSPGFPRDEADTTCLPFPQLLVKQLKKNNPGLQVIILAFQYPFEARTYEWQGAQVIAFGGRNRGRIQRVLLWRRVLLQLKKIHRENKIIGILNLWLGECALIGHRFARRHQLTCYTWLLGQDAQKKNFYYHLTSPRATELIALSDFLSDEFYANYGVRPTHTILPGIDTGAFPLPLYTARTIDIIGVGSLIPLKQYDLFIKIVGELVKKNSQLRAVICGKGPQRQALDRLIRAGELQSNIVLLGETSHPETLRLLQQSRLLLHPSRYEGFGVVYAEALYAGAHSFGFTQAMHQPFDHQHIAANPTDLQEQVQDFLDVPSPDHSPLLITRIEDTCQQLLSLFLRRD